MAFILHSYVWHDSFKCLIWRIHMRNGMSLVVTHEHRMWLIHIAFILYSYCIHIAFIRVTLLVQMFEMTHSFAWHASFIYVVRGESMSLAETSERRTWLIHTAFILHSYVWHDSFKCLTWYIHVLNGMSLVGTRERLTWLFHMHSCIYRYMYYRRKP